MSSKNAPAQETSGHEAQRLPPASGVDADGLVHHVSSQFPRAAIITTDGEVVVGKHELSAFDLDTREGWIEYVSEEVGWASTWADEQLTASEIDAAIAEQT